MHRVVPVFADAHNACEVNEALQVHEDEDEDLYRDAGQGGHGRASARAIEREVGRDQFPFLPSSVWAVGL
jgi:hypothetical protein